MKKEIYEQIKKELSLSEKQKEKFSAPNPTEPANKQVVEVLLKTCASDSRNDNYLDSSDVIDTIRKQASCVFNKDKYAEDQRKSMAALIDDRNNQTLKDTCVRNRKYLGLDEDMVLDPSLKWSVPASRPPLCVGGKNDYKPTIDQTSLIGTLLEDASKTKVGDVVDFHPPK